MPNARRRRRECSGARCGGGVVGGKGRGTEMKGTEGCGGLCNCDSKWLGWVGDAYFFVLQLFNCKFVPIVTHFMLRIESI